eukprot:scaffold1807_cov140-Cylindrotheca_fusiformis.AAC.20
MEQAETASLSAPRASSSSLLLPSEFVQDPAEYLTMVASEPPSYEALRRLAGSVASWFQSPQATALAPSALAPDAIGNIGSMYLQAAAAQLRQDTPSSSVSSFREPTGRRMDEIELLHNQQKCEVIEAVGAVATQCMGNRIAITTSGILPALAQIALNAPDELSLASVEFLQCALMAEQYRFAARLIEGTWPRPTSAATTTSSVKHVLRYYYLRGMIHLGCNDYVMAHRCFWTCLSIPSDSVSKIALEAWKKMALVQCLMDRTGGSSTSGTNSKIIQTPKSMPNCMVRLLSSCQESSKRTDSTSTTTTATTTTTTGEAMLTDILQQGGGGPPEVQLPSSHQRRLSEKNSVETVACYMNLMDAFFKRDKTTFQSLMATHEEGIFREDGNVGLVQQCLTQLVRNQVVHLSNMYSVVPVSKVATLLGLEEDDDDDGGLAVTRVLLESKVPCEIQDDGMVTFCEENASSLSSLSSKPSAQPSMVDISEWMHLIDEVQKLDVAIVTNPEFHALLRRESANKKEGGAGGAGGATGPRGVEDIRDF